MPFLKMINIIFDAGKYIDLTIFEESYRASIIISDVSGSVTSFLSSSIFFSIYLYIMGQQKKKKTDLVLNPPKIGTEYLKYGFDRIETLMVKSDTKTTFLPKSI